MLSNNPGAELKVIGLDLESPTKDFTKGPAMSWAVFLDAIEPGMAQVDEDADLVCVGEMEIGNTTVAAAIAYALYGGDTGAWIGQGTGVDADGLVRKAAVIAEGRARLVDLLDDPLEIARCLGGRELAAMAGAVLAARRFRIPVLVDGYVASAALAPFHIVNNTIFEQFWSAHVSSEPGHVRLLEQIGLSSLLDLGMRLGAGSGAATAIFILRAVV